MRAVIAEVNLSTEKRLEAIEKTLGEVSRKLTIVQSFAAMQQSHESWVSKEVLCALIGLSSESVNTYVTQGKIKKRGTLYSYRSYLEYLEVYKTRKAGVLA